MITNSNSFMIFHSVVQHGGFSTAARKLNLSQSSVSRHVQKCEEQLGGVVLINRTTKTFSITQTGMSVFHNVDQFLSRMDTIKNEHTKPVISFSVIPTWAVCFFNNFLDQFHFEFELHTSDYIIQDESFDVYFRMGKQFPPYNGYTLYNLGRETIYIMGKYPQTLSWDELKMQEYQQTTARPNFWYEVFSDSNIKTYPAQFEHVFMTYQSHKGMVSVPVQFYDYVTSKYDIHPQHTDPILSPIQYGLYVHQNALKDPNKSKTIRSLISKLQKLF